MFKKPYRLKSQVQLKSSEKKKIREDVKKYMRNVAVEDIDAVFNTKDDMIKCRITTFNDVLVDLYLLGKVPMLIHIVDEEILLPTVFWIWKAPTLLPVIVTFNMVYNKLKNGADLFMPGVNPPGSAYNTRLFEKNQPVSINLMNDMSSVAVGQALLNQCDIKVEDTSGKSATGKVVKVYHIAGDCLFREYASSTPLNFGNPAGSLNDLGPFVPPSKAAGKGKVMASSQAEAKDVELTEDILKEDKQDLVPAQESELETPPEDMKVEEVLQNDKLLKYCFLKAIKTSPKTIYPLLAATFYAKNILPNVPSEESLNIKKTRWKKFSTFLQEMSIEGIIQLEEIKKNEYKIMNGNNGHPKVREFVDIHNKVPSIVCVKPSTNGQPVIQQVFCVTAATLPFFEKQGRRKKDQVTKVFVRDALNDYVKKENLQHPTESSKVILDPLLYGMLKKEVLSRGDLLADLLSKMTVEHTVSNIGLPLGESIVHKGKLPNIEFQVATRSGNKKVTLISNLECYGVDVDAFSKELQHAAAASCCITPNVPGKKGPQLQVQGNQIHHALAILTEKQINKKYMSGLDLMLKQKK